MPGFKKKKKTIYNFKITENKNYKKKNPFDKWKRGESRK